MIDLSDLDDVLATEPTFSDSSDSALRLICSPLFLLFVTLFLFYPFIVTMNDMTTKYQQDVIVDGIDSALQSFTINYEMSNDNLKNLSEGYLNRDDPTEYNYYSNALSLDRKKAFASFRKVMCDSTVFTEQELINQFKLIRVYTEFNQESLTPTYCLEFYNLDGTQDGALVKLTSLADVQSRIEQKYACSLDFYRNVTPEASLRKAQAYAREELYQPNQKTASSYNTFICLATNVKLQKNFYLTDKYITFAEVQTYSSARMGVNDERENVNGDH